MSRLPPISARLSCGSLNYGSAGSSLRYFGRQLKQNLALVRAWSPNAALFFNTGRLSRVRRKLLIHPCTTPISGALRARSLFDLQWHQSYVWYLKRVRVNCAGFRLLGSSVSSVDQNVRTRCSRLEPASLALPKPLLLDGVINPQRNGGLSKLGSHPSFGLQPESFGFNPDAERGTLQPWAQVYPAAFGVKNVTRARGSGLKPRSLPLALAKPATERALVVLHNLASATRSRAGYQCAHPEFSLDAWAGKLQSRSDLERSGLVLPGAMHPSVGPAYALGHVANPSPAEITVLRYRATGPIRVAASGRLGQRKGPANNVIDSGLVNLGVSPLPRLGFVRTYNQRATLVKFSFTEGRYARSAGQRLRSLRRKGGPTSRAGLTGSRSQPGIMAHALVSASSNRAEWPSATASKCGFVRAKARFTFDLTPWVALNAAESKNPRGAGVNKGVRFGSFGVADTGSGGCRSLRL